MFFTARYCGHDSFDILYFGGYEKTKKFGCNTVNYEILQIQHSDDYKDPEIVSSLAVKRFGSVVVYLKGNVYIFGGFDDRDSIIKPVEMYCLITKTCKVVANIDDINDFELENFAVCGFMNKTYLFGGWDKYNNEKDFCIEFDTKDFSWKHKSNMNEIRVNPSACV